MKAQMDREVENTNCKVLLVEDNPADALLMEVMLQEQDELPCTIHQADRLSVARDMVYHEKYDLIFLDMGLPDSQGFQTFLQLYQIIPDIPIVILSGTNDKTLAKKAVESGAQDYLLKGVGDSETIARVAQYAIGRKRVEEELRKSQELLRQSQKMEGMGRLAGGVAHDFNNLLTAVLGYARMLEDTFESDDPRLEDIREIIGAGQRAASLTKQLLAFGKKQSLDIKPLDVNEIIEDMEQLLRRTLGEDIKIVTNLNPECGIIKSDAGQVEQILMNLCVNAHDAMPVGGTLTITTDHITLGPDAVQRKILDQTEYVKITVTDTGCGMPEDVIEHAFEPFFTTKHKDKGTGLGLATVYSIIKQFNGHIEIHSEPGNGTEFVIFLPSVDDVPVSISVPDPERALGGNETILLVEDEATLRRLASRILKSLGYHVIQARSGNLALDIANIHEGSIDLVLTDVVMPQMDGPTMVTKMKQYRSDFKTIYMSGFTEGKLNNYGIGNHKNHLLTKPYTHTALAKMVRDVLDGVTAPS